MIGNNRCKRPSSAASPEILIRGSGCIPPSRQTDRLSITVAPRVTLLIAYWPPLKLRSQKARSACAPLPALYLFMAPKKPLSSSCQSSTPHGLLSSTCWVASMVASSILRRVWGRRGLPFFSSAERALYSYMRLCHLRIILKSSWQSGSVATEIIGLFQPKVVLLVRTITEDFPSKHSDV